jgi:hypothetical protein
MRIVMDWGLLCKHKPPPGRALIVADTALADIIAHAGNDGPIDEDYVSVGFRPRPPIE